MSEPSDVLIVGGGVIGLTAAWYLAGAGVSVTLVDRADFGQQASWAGAGIIPPGDPRHARTAFDQLRAHSARLYPALSGELKDLTGQDNGYVVCGGVEFPEAGEDASALPTEEWRTEGIVFRALDRAGLRECCAGLAPDLPGGCHLPEMAQVRNPRHVKALRAGCAARGVRLLPDWEVRELLRRGNRVEAVCGDSGRLSAGRFLIAAGAWTDALLGQVGWRPGVRPVRGQIALLETGHEGVRPILLQGKRYLVPRTDGRVLVGSTEEDAGFDARPTGLGIHGLLGFAVQLVPALGSASLERCWAGLRPASPDGLPFLGPVPGWDNLFVAAGHFRSGIQLSPATGVVLTELLTGRPLTIPLHDFRLDRPPGLPARTAFRS
jgi:glycine oxidase